MKKILLNLLGCFFVTVAAPAQTIRVDPVGVNVNANGATTVFLTFGGVANYRPAEAVWCGALISANPDLGQRCDPATIFGSLPSRFNLAASSGIASLTDIMSIPPSVARRAYQAAQRGEDSAFFYVRRFINALGGPDEYVVVICRMTDGTARSPFSLTEVKLSFATEAPVLQLPAGGKMPSVKAVISYNGTGRLKGRWEVVLPGDEPPEAADLLTEASLPAERRGTQRRYTELSRFNLFLPPGGRVVLDGPDPPKIPTQVEGPHLILLRVEASDDRESDSNLAAVGAGLGVVHSGAVAGFPLPVLRYFVDGPPGVSKAKGKLAQLEPQDEALITGEEKVNLTWMETGAAALLRVDVVDDQTNVLLSALVPPGVGAYRLPPWLKERSGGKTVRWRIAELDAAGAVIAETPWRSLRWHQYAWSHSGASAGRADARRRDAGDVKTSSRSGNAADARRPPRPFGLRPAGPPAALLAPYIPHRVCSSFAPCRPAWGPQQSATFIH